MTRYLLTSATETGFARMLWMQPACVIEGRSLNLASGQAA